MTPTSVSTILTDIRIQINPKIRIRIRITFVSNFGVRGGLHSLLQTMLYVILRPEAKKIIHVALVSVNASQLTKF